MIKLATRLCLLSVFVIAMASQLQARPICDPSNSAVSWSNVQACTSALQSPHLSNYDRAMTLNIRGNNYDGLKQYDLAIADYSKVISLLPDFAYGYANRGMDRCRKGDCRGALLDYDKALSLNPENDWARYGRGIARIRSDDFAGGRADILAVNSRGWDTAAAYREIGMTPFIAEVIVPTPNLLIYWAPIVLISMMAGGVLTLLAIGFAVLRARRNRTRAGR